MQTVQKIASGADHLVCLTVDGRIFTSGCAEQGQLGRVPEMFSDRGGRKGFLFFPMFHHKETNQRSIYLYRTG